MLRNINARTFCLEEIKKVFVRKNSLEKIRFAQINSTKGNPPLRAGLLKEPQQGSIIKNVLQLLQDLQFSKIFLLLYSEKKKTTTKTKKVSPAQRNSCMQQMI